MAYLLFPRSEQDRTKTINLLNAAQDLKYLAFRDFVECGFYRPDYNHIIYKYSIEKNIKFDQYQTNNLSFNLGTFLRWCNYENILEESELELRNLRKLEINTHRFKENYSLIDLNWTYKLGLFHIKNKDASVTFRGKERAHITSDGEEYIYITPGK